MKSLYGRVLKKARRVRGLTQEQLADHMDMCQPSLSDIERGERTAPEPTRELARALKAEHRFLLAAWKLSQPHQAPWNSEDASGRREWYRLLRRSLGIDITLAEFDALMREHVDPTHPASGRPK